MPSWVGCCRVVLVLGGLLADKNLTAEVLGPYGLCQYPLHEVEEQIYDLVNLQRQLAGLPALRLDADLMRGARHHAAWMARTQRLVHTGAMVGENIALGQANGCEAVADWLESPGHRANIYNAAYTRTGVAAFAAEDGRVYYCQQFLFDPPR